jgi:hypothetical protein
LVIASAVSQVSFAATNQKDGSQPNRDQSAALLEAAKQDGSAFDATINSLLAQLPDNQAIRGLGGYIRCDRKWQELDAVAKRWRDDENLRIYLDRRGRYPNTAAGQRTLADWCAKHSLPDQQRAHLARALQLAPDDAEVRAELGYVRIDGMWVLSDDLIRARQAMQIWIPRLEALVRVIGNGPGVAGGHDSDYDRAFTEWKAIDDSAAIPAMEATFSTYGGSRGAMMVVEKLRKLDGTAAAMSLARHAVLADDPDVRTAAVAELKKRPLEYYVPTLLGSLYTPASVQAAIVSTVDGRLMLREVFAREAANHKEVTTVDSLYRFVNDDPNSPVSRRRQIAQVAQTDIARENIARAELNNRICAVLVDVTGVRLPAAPERWWQWWNDYNEVYVEGQKQTTTAYYRQEATIVYQPMPIAHNSARSESDESKDCLVAGTSVWTEHGPVAIEKLRVGDLVLAQDAKSGELAFRPILKTTKRRPSLLVAINTGDTHLQASGGHRFWVTGNGWVKARELTARQNLYGIGGGHGVVSVAADYRATTFNIVVADFHTYFVGPNKLLSHDNTIPEPALTSLPGVK